MDTIESLSRSELIAILRTYEQSKENSGAALVQHLSHELSAHCEALSLQNEELREIANELNVSRNRYAGLYDFAPVGFATLNHHGEIIEMNLTAAQMLGGERIQLLGRPFSLQMLGEQRGGFLSLLRDAMQTDQKLSGDFTFAFLSRPEIHVQIDAIPERENGETVIRISMTDVTERYTAEEELRRSQASFEAIIENTQDAIWMVDHDYKIIRANIAFETLRGSIYPLGIERGAGMLSPAAQRWRGYYDRAFRGERFSVEEEHTMLGQRVYWEFSFNPVFMRMGVIGEVSGISVFAKNVSARHQLSETMRLAKERAEEQSKYRSNVLSNLSHELRTPLNAMLSYTTLIGEIAEKQEVRDYIEVVHRNGERLVHMVNHSLDLARLEAGHVTLDLRVIDPREIIEQQVRLLTPMAQEHGLYLRLGPSSSGPISVDRALFEQILTNLVGNAIKYTESGGITIEIASGLDEIEIRVRDTGIGISEDFLPYIFDEFKRESHELNDRIEGSGLGLSITRKQVEIMDGRVGCFSAQGKGSTFWVRFPRVEPNEEIRKAMRHQLAATAPKRSRFTESRLLLVEDDPDQAEGIRAILEGDWNIDIAKNGEAAIALADRHVYDGVLLDVGLGNGMTGFDVSRRLRKLPRFTNVPIIAMTGNPEYNRENALTSGCDALLIKPVTSEIVSKALETLLAEMQL